MDLFDVLSAMFYPGQTASRRRRSPSENLAAAIALFLLPLVEVGITVIWHLKDPMVVCVVLPLVFGALAYFVARTLANAGYSLWLALGCAATCFLWGCFIVVIALMTWSY
jgi:hypothetical protein